MVGCRSIFGGEDGWRAGWRVIFEVEGVSAEVGAGDLGREDRWYEGDWIGQDGEEREINGVCDGAR